jgi:hypothetical protein
MRITSKFFMLLIATLILFSACKKKKDEPEPTPEPYSDSCATNNVERMVQSV